MHGIDLMRAWPFLRTGQQVIDRKSQDRSEFLPGTNALELVRG
jgi:hypothetical protein